MQHASDRDTTLVAADYEGSVRDSFDSHTIVRPDIYLAGWTCEKNLTLGTLGTQVCEPAQVRDAS